MLKHLGGDYWARALNVPRHRIPEVLILRGTRNLKAQYQRHRRLFTDVLDLESPNGLFEDVLVGRYGGRSVAYASVYGGPMASEITHAFGRMGARVVIQTGCCGAVAADLSVGEVVVATAAHCGDGASRYYVGEARVAASPGLVAAARSALEAQASWLSSPVPYSLGPFYSTAALLAEGREELLAWRGLGARAVDMEMAATYAVASWLGMQSVGFGYVFDNPWAGEHLAAVAEARRHLRERGDEAVLQLALHLVRTLP